MAVDTRDKRSSAINIASPWRGMLPTPGTLDEPDRQHVAFMYRGIESDDPAPPAPAPERHEGGLMVNLGRFMGN